MASATSAYVVLSAAALTASAGVGLYAWRYREEPGGRYVLIFAAAAVVWTGGEALAAASGPIAAKALWFRVLIVGVVGTHPAWLLFVLVYSGRWALISRRTVAAVWAVPAAAAVLTVTNPLHGLVFTSVYPISSGAGFDFTPGPAFVAWGAVATTYLLATVGLLLDTASRAPAYYRRQIGLLLLGAIAPAIAAMVRIAGLTTTDLTPAGLVVSGVALVAAISRTGFLDVTPVARNAVVEAIDAAVFVVDRRDRLVDANDRARALLGADRSVVGRPMAALLAPFPGVYETYRQVAESGVEETELEFTGGTYQVDVSELTDHRDRLIGRVYLVSDVTERKRRERELARQNERLGEFASVVSHDLRNPLSIASGHLELARADGDDEHLGVVAESMERMETIVDDVLTLAREGRTVSEEDRTEASLGSLSRRAWTTIATGDAALEVDADVELAADPERLRRALENLFRNSVEHGVEGSPRSEDDEQGSPTGAEGGVGSDQPAEAAVEAGGFRRGGGDAPSPSLTVRVGPIAGPDPPGDPIGFYVEDDGRGIPAEEREAVLKSGYSTDPDGTGFGLAIVSDIVEAHGWEIEVTASAAGGARFEITGVEAA